MQNIKSVKDADVSGKRVILRVDFNVPIKNGAVADDTRIKAALPTIELLQKKGAAHITLLTHVGRPEGKIVESLRVAPIEKRLRELCDAPNVSMEENVRFNPGEDANDPAYAKEFAQLGDVFVNDAFADSHRAHASVVGIAALLPAYAGLLIEKEIENLEVARTPPAGAVAIIGGAKFETKQPLIEKLLGAYSKVLLGGALGNDVIKSRGLPIGTSLVSVMPVPMSLASNDTQLIVATDAYVRNNSTSLARSAPVSDTRADEMIVDIGPDTAEVWSKIIAAAPFILWNGPMGIYEDGFTTGTDLLAQALVASGCRAVVGGGDTIAALFKTQFDPSKVFLSTGGGAMLEYLTQGTLPGIEVLKKS